jgi:hypothetical protein
MKDPLKILAALDSDNKPSTSDLTAAHTDMRDALRAAITDARESSGDEAKEAKALAAQLRAGVDKIASELDTRAKEDAETKAQLDELAGDLFDDDSKSGDKKTADSDTGASSKNDDGTGSGDTSGQKQEKKAEEPVAASASDIIARIKSIGSRRAPAQVIETVPRKGMRMAGLGPAQGDRLDNGDFRELGDMFSLHAKKITSVSDTGNLFRITREFDESRQLGFNSDVNNRRMLDLFGTGSADSKETPVAAACGLCGPGDVDHSHPICSEEGRPIRDALPNFQATRGKITFAPAMSIGDLRENVSIWTLEMDEAACLNQSPGWSPGSPPLPSKPCPPITCPEELTCATDAVTRCVTVGNFQAIFSPEFWAATLALLKAEFDRVAEQKIIEEIHAASVDLGTMDGCNTLQTFLTGINTVVAADRSAQRNMSRRYRVIADAFIRDYIRNQVITNLGVANNIDVIQVADATINGWLSSIGVDVVWTFDGTFDPQFNEHRVMMPGDTPASAGVYVHPVDSFVFLDGGTLDLGTNITDSMLNSTNDRQAFAESFEKTCFRGCSAYYFDLPILSGCGCSNETCTIDSPAMELAA